MVSWAWCIVRNEIFHNDFYKNICEFSSKLELYHINYMFQHNIICIWNKLCHISYVEILKKMKCELHSKCVAYTFEQSRLICILHSSTDKGQKYTRGKQTGVKKTDFKLSLPEISRCFDQTRERRCRREPKCNHVDCFRNAQEFLDETAGDRINATELK